MNNAFLNRDLHSQYVPGQPQMSHLDWTATVLFEERKIHGTAIIRFDASGETTLDTRDLLVHDVRDSSGNVIESALGKRNDLLGSALTFVVPDDCTVRIDYATSDQASGLMWLSAEQNGGKPFMFTQGQAIHARSYVPCQDTPGVRFTFDMEVSVPVGLRGLAAAPEHLGTTSTVSRTTERWRMPYAVPAYLLAIAVGDLEERKLSDRTSVWALPGMIDAAERELLKLPTILEKAEGLFGPYPWGTYSVLVMPPAFPYGGMENPCLTFVNPSVIAGDESGVSVVIHELAHSWTGNLVTNATHRDFALNEGWTVYGETRITEEVYGIEEALIRLRLLESEYRRDERERFSGPRPLMTTLAPDLAGIDPDDIFSRVPYYKGSLMLLTIEHHVGRFTFDNFVLAYIDRFRFSSIRTSDFLRFLVHELPGVMEELELWRWVYEAGIPDNATPIISVRISQIEELAAAGRMLPEGEWTAMEIMLYLELLPHPADPELLATLDDRFRLSWMQNAEVRWAFLLVAVESGYLDVRLALEDFLLTQGRMKYLFPLYRALCRSIPGLSIARDVFVRAKSGYHPTTIKQIVQYLEGDGT